MAKQKLKAEAGITTGGIQVRACTHYGNIKSVHLPPEDHIVALYFGTTHCSLAITIGSNSMSCLKFDGYCPKVPMAILLRKLDSLSATVVPCEIRAFGKKAQETHMKLKPNEVSQHLLIL